MENVFELRNVLLKIISDEYDDYIKVCSNLDSLKLSKEEQYITPLYIEVLSEDFSEPQGIGLTIEQTKELIETLQRALNYLEG